MDLMANAPTVRTASDVAFDTIREKILSGELPPGSKLTRRGMAELSGVSVIPVIEAIHRLEFEGLVESQPLVGSRVVTLDDQRTRDVFALREAVECQVARMLVGQLSGEQAAHYRGLAATLDANLYTVTPQYDVRQLWQLHYHFHAGLAGLTGCPSLQTALRRVNLYELLRGVVSRNRQRAERMPADWHGRLIDVLVAGSPDEAEGVFRTHVRSSLDRSRS
jgi:DNA-binding GntR family transcriptional regulator